MANKFYIVSISTAHGCCSGIIPEYDTLLLIDASRIKEEETAERFDGYKACVVPHGEYTPGQILNKIPREAVSIDNFFEQN